MNPICPNCGAMIRPGASFCGTCRQPLAPSSVLASSSGPAPPSGWGAAAAPAATLWTDDGRQFPLSAPSTRIGRDPGNDIYLADGRVSGRHAEVVQSAAGYVLRDLGSRNGTYVNGQRIVGDCPLSDGDLIVVGGTRLTFRHSSGASGGAGPMPRTQAMDPADVQSMLASGPQPQASLPAPWPGSGASVPAPLQPGSSQSITSQPSSSGSTHGFWARLTAPTVVGPIVFEPTEAQEDPPTDISRVLVMLAVMLAFFGAIGIFIAAMIVVSLVLMCLGAAALLFVVPFLFMPMQMLFSTIMGWLGEQKQVTTVRFRIDDEISGQPVDVVLIRKLGQGGGLHQGDRVEIWGRIKGGALYATKVRVDKSGATIPARKPWPLWIGLLALAAVIGSLVYLAVALGLIQL